MTRRIIYCDANAGVPALPEAVAAYLATQQEGWANPSSTHPLGAGARAGLDSARAAIATYFGVSPDAVVFTSGGTESNALALLGSLQPGAHVVTTAIEHPSVARTLRYLATEGRVELTVVPVARDGRVRVAEALAACRAETRLVSCVAVCNETGVIQPISELAAALQARGICLHSDAVQAVGKVPMGDLAGADLLSMSGHKVGAVGGVGVLVRRGDWPLHQILGGGGQERGLRGGTENTAGAASLAAALHHLPDGARLRQLESLRDRFETALRTRLSDVEVVGADSPRVANTSAVCLGGCEADGLLIALDLDGIAVSTGSACSSGSIEPSPILLGMGLTRDEAKQVLRYSFLCDVTVAEIDTVVDATVRMVLRMRD